jgi:hypothetical protein
MEADFYFPGPVVKPWPVHYLEGPAGDGGSGVGD